MVDINILNNIIFSPLLFYYYIKSVKSTLNFITKNVNIVYKLLGSRKFATITIYLLTFLFHFWWQIIYFCRLLIYMRGRRKI